MHSADSGRLTAEDFLFTELPIAVAEAVLPSPASTERVQLRIEGEPELTMHVGVDADGDVTFLPGAHERPVLELVFGPGFRSLVGGRLWARLRDAPGWIPLFRRLVGCVTPSRRRAEQLARLRGVLELEVHDGDADRATLRAVLGRGAGPERRCLVRTDASAAVALGCGLIDPRAWVQAAPHLIQGDRDLFGDVVEALFRERTAGGDFLFVYHRARREFVLRLRIVHGPREVGVQGTVLASEADEVMSALRSSFGSPEHVVERMWATSWDAVEENFVGLYEHD